MTQAKVCKVTGKLQYTSDLQWCLTVVVTDDSHKQLSVKLSNEVRNIFFKNMNLKKETGIKSVYKPRHMSLATVHI